MQHQGHRHRFFPDVEYQRRRDEVRERMSQLGLDGVIIASPENVNYLCGLDHMGYFACQLLILPRSGDPILVTRAMERAVVRDQAPDVVHVGYADGVQVAARSATPDRDAPWTLDISPPTAAHRRRPSRDPSAVVDATVKALHDHGLAGGVLALDQHSTFLPYSVAEGILEGTPEAEWHNLGSVVDDVRLVQSPLELEQTRRAARISDAMMLSAIAAAGADVNAREIMASIYDAMFRRGGTYPGFVPLVRSNRNLEHEHGTWDDQVLEPGELLFLEMAGCVRRYHAPLGRLVFIEQAPPGSEAINDVCGEAMEAAAGAICHGARAGDVYEHWQGVLDRHGLSHYTRHHCGYTVGIGYPPSWSGPGVPLGLRRDSDMVLKSGMVFHLMSWLLQSGRGDAFLSDTIVVTETGCEFLTTVSRDVIVR